MTMRRRAALRHGLRSAGGLVLLLGARELAFGAGIVAVRVWPAEDYTRVTLESDAALSARHSLAENPSRVVIDIDGLELSPQLRELVGKVRADDPFIAGVRVGQNQPRVVRLVIDLKQATAPQVFTLAPVAAYQYRLVFDLYPTKEPDPLLALIRDKEQAEGEAAKAVNDALGEFIGKVEKPPVHAEASGAGAGSGTGSAVASGAGSGAASAASVVAGGMASAPSPVGGNGTAVPPGTTAAVPHGNSPPLPPITTPSVRPPPAPPPIAAASPPNAPAAPLLPTPAERGRINRLVIVALDPGHGGEDPGATGPSGLHEKDVVLAVGLKLRDRLNAVPGMRVMMTRDADFFVPLGERVRRARRVQADLFVSIHADAFLTPEARGASVFALSERGASSSAARWMADRENSADSVGGVNIATRDSTVLRTLLDMSTTAQIKDSLRLGNEVLQRIGQVGKLHKGSVEQASFAVLKAPDIPSILVETAFISNPDEEAKLRSPAYQEKLVEALTLGITRYFAKNPPLARNRTL